MRCTPIDLGNGVTGIVCTRGRGSLPACSTPGCRRKGRLECDHPVEREHPAVPKRGDARLHRKHGVVFYVWSVTGDQVTVSTGQPGASRSAGMLQTVSLADWWAKTSATCDRPICERCSVRRGGLDICPAHARAGEGGMSG